MKRSILLSIALLSFFPVVGLAEVGRSEAIVPLPDNQSQEIDQLIRQLKTGDSETRSKAAYSLYWRGKSAKSAIPTLIPLLNDQNASVRSSAARVLGSMGESAKSAIPSLISLLNDQDEFVRSGAANALGSMGESAKSAIPSLNPTP
jgi:HEAT repeat protein